jgi:xylose isomerase
MTITAAIIHGAIVKEQSERHPVDQAYFGFNGSGWSDYLFNGKMSLDRVAEIINETKTTTEKKP